MRQQTAMIGRPNSRPTLAWIKCPTLVLTGDEDNTIPNSLSKEMADGIHGAKLVILPNCGHLPQPEQPQATAEAPGRMAAELECGRLAECGPMRTRRTPDPMFVVSGRGPPILASADTMT